MPGSACTTAPRTSQTTVPWKRCHETRPDQDRPARAAGSHQQWPRTTQSWPRLPLGRFCCCLVPPLCVLRQARLPGPLRRRTHLPRTRHQEIHEPVWPKKRCHRWQSQQRKQRVQRQGMTQRVLVTPSPLPPPSPPHTLTRNAVLRNAVASRLLQSCSCVCTVRASLIGLKESLV